MRRLQSTEPIWAEPAAADLPALSTDARADVCVVGAGIAGLTTAYLLCAQGRSVIVLEEDGVGAGETGRTTAHLTCVLDLRYQHLQRLHGEKNARLAAASHVAAIDLVESLTQTESIDCGFEWIDGYLMGGSSEAIPELEEELEAARAVGLPADLLARASLPFESGPVLRFPDQAQLHPRRYLAGLALAIRRRGGTIDRARALELEGDEGEARVTTDRGLVVRAGSLVIATHAPVHQRLTLHVKQTAYRTYVIGARLARGSVAPGLYWDTRSPYHYLRVVDGGPGNDDVLLVGGEDHKTGQGEAADERFFRLEGWARYRFPNLLEMKFRWSGQVLEPADGLAFIGRSPSGPPNVYVATGFSGNGMTYGTIAGRLITDLIVKGSSQWASLYEPSRLRLRAAGRYLMDGLSAAARYGELATSGEVGSAVEIPAGTGAVIRRGLSKVAVYRDGRGLVHEISAHCTHLGCIVHWNGAEKSWDCPCHGSRFAPDGTVLNGPASEPLAPLGATSVQKA